MIFKGDYYPMWAIQAQSYLKKLGMWENLESATGQIMDKEPVITLAHLMHTIEPELGMQYIHMHARDVWLALEGRFAIPSAQKIQHLHDQIHACRSTDHKNIEEYINALRKLFAQLRCIGKGWDPELEAGHLIRNITVSVVNLFINNYCYLI